MLNYKIIAVIKKQLREKLFSRSFILMTLLIPLFMFSILGLQTFILQYENDEMNLVIVTEDADFRNSLETEFNKTDFVKSSQYRMSYQTLRKDEVPAFVNSRKEDMLSDKLTGIIFIPSASPEGKKAEYYSKTPNSISVLSKLKEPINKVLLDRYFLNKNFTPEDINFAKQNVDFSGFKISKGDQIEQAGEGNTIVSFLFTFLLYMSLLMIGSMMMSSVIEEKTSRVVEILLSSLDSRDLLAGKILGTAITSVIQMIVWLSPLILLISTTWFMLPQEYLISLSLTHIIYFLINYLIALITFLGMFAAAGSMFENSQDAQQGVWPIMILIMIPFFISLGMISNPENSIAKIASMVPFASLIVMPARMTIVDVPVWEFALSILVNIATMFMIFVLAGKIYRIGILKTGKKPKLSEIISWLKYSS
jgi:ABC-2 type transport system permease protein